MGSLSVSVKVVWQGARGEYFQQYVLLYFLKKMLLFNYTQTDVLEILWLKLDLELHQNEVFLL